MNVIIELILCATSLAFYFPHQGGNNATLAGPVDTQQATPQQTKTADSVNTPRQVSETSAESDKKTVNTPRQVSESSAKSDKKTADATQQVAATSAESAEKEIDGVKLLAIEANVVSYTNEERARYGLQPFAVDKELMDTAREHCEWMTRNRSMVHTHRPVAENIAMGQPSSGDVVRAWMNSPGHRANILNPGNLHIGVAAFRTAEGTIFWCQQFRR
jgi:uncharacterized protein YkwD